MNTLLYYCGSLKDYNFYSDRLMSSLSVIFILYKGNGTHKLSVPKQYKNIGGKEYELL